MKEQTKRCREHTEMFPCLKRRDIVTQASTWINLRMLSGTHKKEKKMLHGAVPMRRVLEANGGDSHKTMRVDFVLLNFMLRVFHITKNNLKRREQLKRGVCQ